MPLMLHVISVAIHLLKGTGVVVCGVVAGRTVVGGSGNIKNITLHSYLWKAVMEMQEARR